MSEEMQVTFQRPTKPSLKVIWAAVGKPAAMTIIGIERTPQPYESPIWTVHVVIDCTMRRWEAATRQA